MKFNHSLASIMTSMCLVGCAAMGVPATNDPIKKLDHAVMLFNDMGRPLPAERLIAEAIEICERTNNNACLGKAYLDYGFFFRSTSIIKWEKYYRKNGFYDKTATYDNRILRSKENFEKSISYYLKTNEYDALTNAYLHLGHAYYFLRTSNSGDWIEARENLPEKGAECEPYAKSLEYNHKNLEANPDANVALPKGVSSFKEYIRIHQKRAGCI